MHNHCREVKKTGKMNDEKKPQSHISEFLFKFVNNDIFYIPPKDQKTIYQISVYPPQH